MESKTFLFTSVPIILIILVFSYLNIQQEKSLNSTVIQDNLVQCQRIVYNGEDRIDMLFISSKEDAQHYAKVLFDTEPYKKYNNYFNIYVLEEEPECEYYKEIAIFCNTNQVKSIAKQCPNDYIAVIKKDTPQIRSSAYGNVISINSAHDDSVLIHELGHALGNLAEEYEGAKIPSGSKNCVSSCNKFEGLIDSCKQGCSTSTHYRSIPEGVMRTLATSDYGIYDIALISELLNKNKPREATITGNQIYEQNSCNDKILSIEILSFENGGATVSTDYNLKKGCFSDKGLAGEVCIGNVCNINTLFTDSQDIENEKILKGETYLNAEKPLIFYIEQNPSNPKVDIIINNRLIKTINTALAGATACKV